VKIVINRGAAGVHLDLPGLLRKKFFFASGYGVIKIQHE
jgi:hypothetical protein